MLILGGRGAFPGSDPATDGFFSDVIYDLDLDTFQLSKLGFLPSVLCSHCSAVIEDKYLILYGGTNGLRFFDSIVRYEFESKKWMIMTKNHPKSESSSFFKFGRIASSSCLVEDMLVLFGGCSSEGFFGDFLVIPTEHLKNDSNFSEIQEIMWKI